MEKISKAFPLEFGIIQGNPITNNTIMRFLAGSVRSGKRNAKYSDRVNETKLSHASVIEFST